MQTYLLLKHTHMGFAFLSITLFMLRGGLMLAGSPRLNTRLLRILPHVVDTLLLSSALALAILMHYDPRQQPWLMAKIVAVVAYILLGSVALKRGRTKTLRAAAFIMALLVVAYIIGVAFTKSVWPF
jgi:uncharacterized membrane protein SirB2